MEFIEELIRKSPIIERIESCVKYASDVIIDLYWAEVCTEENLKDYETFDEAWHEWFQEYGFYMDEIAELYYMKSKKDLIWTLYDTDDVAECLKEDFLEPILFKNHCFGSWHEDVQEAIFYVQNDE